MAFTLGIGVLTDREQNSGVRLELVIYGTHKGFELTERDLDILSGLHITLVRSELSINVGRADTLFTADIASNRNVRQNLLDANDDHRKELLTILDGSLLILGKLRTCDFSY